MTSTLQKAAPAGRKFEPKLNLPDRRHSVAHQPSPPEPRRGSTASSRKGSDTPPAWYTAMNQRNGSVSSDPEPRRSSLADGVKGIFGRRKSHDEGATKPKQKVVLTSKHAGQVRNKLIADPRGARKAPAVKAAGMEGTQHSAHLSAAEQEERRPHSGKPSLHGELPMLTRIVSEDERDEEDSVERQSVTSWMKENQSLEKVHESEHESRSKSHDDGMGQIIEEKPRRRSLADVEIKGAEGPRPRNLRSPRGRVWGRWHRNEKGIWTS